MRKNISFLLIISFLLGCLFFMSSCKRTKTQDPDMIEIAGFRISLSGVANPSKLYIPDSQPAVSSQVSVRALNNDGSPAIGYDIIFQVGSYGYLENYKTSDTRTTDNTGYARITFFIPAATNIRAEQQTYIYARLVDDGRVDLAGAEVYDVIPINLVPAVQTGVLVGGTVKTADGKGVEGIPMLLEGDDTNMDAVTVTRGNGSYEFYVSANWSGTVTPSSLATGYSFLPSSYTIPSVSIDSSEYDFIANFAGGDQLVTDITQWNVPVEGGSQEVNVYNITGANSIDYQVLENTDWLTVTPKKGSTNGRFTMIADENTTGETREGTVTIYATSTVNTTVTISVSQEANEISSEARLAIEPTTINFGSNPSGNALVRVYNSMTDETISFAVTSSEIITDNWWAVLSVPSFETEAFVEVSAESNFGEARTTQYIFTPTSSGVYNTVTLTINQEAGPSIAIDIENKNVAVGGESFSVTVTNPTTSDSVPFTVTNNDTWISGSPVSGSTPAGITIIVNANGTGEVRTGRVFFTETLSGDNNQVILTITQQGN